MKPVYALYDSGDAAQRAVNSLRSAGYTKAGPEDLVRLKMINPVLALPFRPLLMFLTGGFLAPVCRDAMGMSWGGGRQYLFETLFRLVAFVNRFLPKFVRTHNYTVLMTDLRWRLKHKKPLI